jgi:predicted kinase
MKKPFAMFMETKLPSEVLLITCGLPGTWKTETAQEISRVKGYPILRTDLIRLDLLKDEDVFDEKAAANMSKRELVYREMFRLAEKMIRVNAGVILDATFVNRKLRLQAVELAARHNRTLVILQTRCSEETSIRRILRRTKENYESNALTRAAYLNNKKMFEPVDLDILLGGYPQAKLAHYVVDTEFDSPEDWYIVREDKR